MLRSTRDALCGAARVTLISGVAIAAQASVLFHDNFSVPGTQLNLADWTTEFGPSSFLGRTQLADWVTPGPGGVFVVGASGAELALNTFNRWSPIHSRPACWRSWPSATPRSS